MKFLFLALTAIFFYSGQAKANSYCDWYKLYYPTYYNMYCQTSVAPAYANPIDGVSFSANGQYYDYTVSPPRLMGSPSSYSMSTSISSSFSLSKIQVRIDYQLNSGISGSTGWVAVTSLGSDWKIAYTIGDAIVGTYVPVGSYLSSGYFTFRVRTSDGLYQKSASLNIK